MVQSGTPSSSNPIYPSETGDRTINLYDDTSTVTLPPGARYGMVFSPGIYSIRNDTDNNVYSYYNDGYGRQEACQPHSTATVNLDQVSTGKSGFFMPYDELSLGGVTIVSGSTPPDHYEPYGYKLPITCGNSTSNIYLQEPIRKIDNYVDISGLSIGGANRRIKKLVLTGEEDWTISAPSGPSQQPYVYIYINKNKGYAIENVNISSHFPAARISVNNSNHGLGVQDKTIPDGTAVLIRYGNITNSVESIKSFLSGQYSSGTPVTIWYALASPTTETTTIPTITTEKGSNTLSIGTSLQPSSVSITGHIK